MEDAGPAIAVQGELFEAAPLSAAGLERLLCAEGGPELRLRVTRNRVAMVSLRAPPRGPVRLRVHEQFLAAPAPVLAALRQCLRQRTPDAWRTVCAFARAIRPAPGGPCAARRAALRTRGRVHDLAAIYHAVNAEFYAGRIACRIGWGRPGARRRRARRRCIRFGSWSPGTRTIRVHPALDDEAVPAAFVRYIVFHELLHAAICGQTTARSGCGHGPDFRQLERRFPGLPAMNRLARELAARLT
jgi:hypothetical protein